MIVCEVYPYKWLSLQNKYQVIMENTTLKRYYTEILSYIEKYENKVSRDNAKEVIDSFKENWEDSINYAFGTKDLGQKYGEVLVIYSAGFYELETLSKDNVELLSNTINSFDKNEAVKYKLGIKTALFGNLALCWHKIGGEYKERTINTLKKYLYYLIAQSYNTSYSPTAYKFRTCNEHFFKSLENENIGLTSPQYFNDPFDCPILELLNNDEDFSKIIRQAYNDCLKITCFSANTKLPYYDDEKQELVQEEKQNGSMPEYCNELMWAHYADSHKGVCIKYHFPNSMTQLADNNNSVICYFGDVTYSNEDISQYSNKETINIYDAFFLKGKQWEYENELRLLYFNLEGKEGFHYIESKNCIEAVYFGLKCSKENQDKIIRILKDKPHITIDLQEKQTKNPVKFYKMVIDKQHFGQVEARELRTLGHDKSFTIKRICLFIRRILSGIIKLI